MVVDCHSRAARIFRCPFPDGGILACYVDHLADLKAALGCVFIALDIKNAGAGIAGDLLGSRYGIGSRGGKQSITDLVITLALHLAIEPSARRV
ncbi:hypothetical protein NSU_0774 [Novosphingobium pentaromativorans US6-1]|uniref:Uncharacterized protein n=1 Tax=Novosphingobium pentaromativorans US6-1 TaxID=1088721 RepID=G6E8V3_9SPHN|nr:hypothetical protein NSU_0774 [Novosphingobium pentaromativorans US6-1]